MTRAIGEILRNHLQEEHPIEAAEWPGILEELHRQIATGPAPVPDADLVRLFLDSHADQIDRHLDPARADRLFAFLDEGCPPAPTPVREALRTSLMERARERYSASPVPAPALALALPLPLRDPSWPAASRSPSTFRALTLLLAGGFAGFVVAVGTMPRPAGEQASPSPGGSLELAMLFPGYDPDHDSFAPAPRALGPAHPLVAALWCDRTDHRYSVGDAVRLGVMLRRPAFVRLIELDTNGDLQGYTVPGADEAGRVPGERVIMYPDRTQSFVAGRPPGTGSLLLVATTGKVPEATFETLVKRSPPFRDGSRVLFLESLRDRFRDWARQNRSDVAFAWTHLTIEEAAPGVPGTAGGGRP